ncbi:WG repeat-containing protein [Flavobacterium sp. J27]|uniref:WG repeat-containing protein n=1 Tax=Flavobacterium sp. J27 TaxID=2060419 RepID=UPI001030C19A|nr:WG repeat-containing protein [Flavobacterium sp. J27]
MRILVLIAFFAFNISFSQELPTYKKVYPYDVYQKDWALVKTITNTYGFIDRNGNELVSPIYSKIYPFKEEKDNRKYALIKNVAGAYGYLNQNGEEVIKAIYFKKEEAKQKLNIILNDL